MWLEDHESTPEGGPLTISGLPGSRSRPTDLKTFTFAPYQGWVRLSLESVCLSQTIQSDHAEP